MSEINFGKWGGALGLAIQAARQGRETLLQYRGRLQNVEKKFQAGWVSEADREAEKIIFASLRKNFPDDEFLGEESTPSTTKVGEMRPAVGGRWIVDPLDGTTNYIHQFPIFAVSIGYEWQGQIQLAVIDFPMLNEVYTAVRGCGAYVNGRKLQVSETRSLNESLLATGFFGEDDRQLEEQIRMFSKIVRESRGVRRAGAATYDLCMVARGVFDGYWEKGLKPWDSAAGILLVEEAGGKVITYKGAPYTPYKNSMIAGNPWVADEIQKRIASLADAGTD